MKLLQITNKQKEILLLLYRFRFLNRIQIQTLLNHKNSKNTNEWLKNLTDKNYIGRIYEKTRSKMFDPAIYYISKNGIKFLREQENIEKDYIKKFYQEKRRSKGFVSECILIANIYLQLKKQYEDKSYDFKFYTKSNFPKQGIVQDLKPSFAYVIKVSEKLDHYACEVLKEGIPRYVIRARIEKYIEFFGQDNQKAYITFYCPNEKIAKYLEKQANKMIEEEGVENIFISVQRIV